MRAVKILLLITVLLGTTPFVPYVWAHLFGSLPDADTWRGRGGNHGPWWGHEPHQSLILLPMATLTFLPLFTLLVTLSMGIVKKRPMLALYGIGLSLLQWGLAFLQLFIVFWTID